MGEISLELFARKNMASSQEPLLKSDDEDDLVFDRTGLLSNKVTAKSDVCQRGLSTGKRMQYVRTVNLCLAFFALGLCFAIPTATLNDLQTTIGADLSDIEFIYTARYSGYVFGSIIGGILFDRYNRQFLLFLSLLATAIGIITMPFCTKVGALMACTAITGITMGFLDTGGNVWCLDLWGKKSAPFMQTLHFCFGLGAFVAPLVAEPFLSPHLGNTTGLMDSSSVNVTLTNVPHVWFPHQRVKAFAEHNLQKDYILQHINSTVFEEADHNTFPMHKLPRHIYETDQNFVIQRIRRQPSKKYIKFHDTTGKAKDNRSIYVRTNLTIETENSTNFNNFSDYYSLNNTNTFQNTSENFASNLSPEDHAVTQFSVTTLAPDIIDSTFSTTLKPKKPHYADGNQLKYDNKWVRTSLKQKTQNDLNKNVKQDLNNTQVTKITATSSGPGLNGEGWFAYNTTNGTGSKNSTDKLHLDNDVNQNGDQRNGTDNLQFYISDLEARKSTNNITLSSAEFIFPTSRSSIMYVTPTLAQNVKSYRNNQTAVTLQTLKNNSMTGKTAITQKDNNSVEKEVIPLMQHTNVSGNLQLHGLNQTEESTKTASSANLTQRNDLQIPSLWSSENFMNLTEISNKTEFKQTSLRSAETKELPSTSLSPIELYHTENVEDVNAQISDEKSSELSNNIHEIGTSVKNVSNMSQISLWDVEERKAVTVITESNRKPKDSHVDFLSNLFATMCQHRLGKFEIAYVILGIYIFIVASIFLICLCLNPREPRSRQEEQLDKSRNITATFKISVVILVSLFLCLYVGIEVAVGQLLQTFTVKQYLQLPESTGYFMTYSFWGSFALARGISIALSIKFSGLCLLFADLILCLTTSVLLVVGANKIEALLWVGIIALAFGMAPIFPAVIAWIEHYLPITNRIASAFILGAALGEMTIPLIIQRFIYQEPMVLMYVNVIVNILCLVTFIALWFLASHQGEKYKIKIDRTMYQLANFDDVEDGYELCFANSRWQNDYNSHILLERKLVGKT